MAQTQWSYGDDPGNNPYAGIGPDEGAGGPSSGSYIAWDPVLKRFTPKTPKDSSPGAGGGMGPNLGAGGGGNDVLPAGQDFTGTSLAPGAGTYPATAGVGAATAATGAGAVPPAAQGFNWAAWGKAGQLLNTYAPILAGLYGMVSGAGKGKFEQQPEDPLLTAARKRQMGFVDQSPMRNLYASLLGGYMQHGMPGSSMAFPGGPQSDLGRSSGLSYYQPSQMNYQQLAPFIEALTKPQGQSPASGAGNPADIGQQQPDPALVMSFLEWLTSQQQNGGTAPPTLGFQQQP